MEGRRQGVVGLSDVVTPRKNDEGDSGHQPREPASSDELRTHSKILRWGRAKVIEIFGADLRSLAVFRIVLALLVLGDLASLITDFSAFYTNTGVLPRTFLTEEVMNRWTFSLNLMNGEAFFQGLVFGVAALAALAMLAGYRTRLMTIIVWVTLMSIQWRNPLVLNSGDALLRLLLFWSMFLPLGAYWSVDRVLKAVPPRLAMRYMSMATVGLFMQIAFIYWFTVLQKSGPEWRTDGTALYYALSIDQFSTPVGAYLYNFPELLKVLTFATMGLEIFGPLLLFFPFFTGPVRTGTVLAFMSFHFGIWTTMYIGIFPWVSAFCMVCFLPSWFWEKAATLRTRLPEQPKITRRLQHAIARPIRAYWSPLRTGHWDQPGGHAAPMIVHSGVETPRQGESQTDIEAKGTEGKVAQAIRRWRDRNDRFSASEPDDDREGRHDSATGSEPTLLRSSLATNVLALFFLLYIFCLNLTTVSTFTMPTQIVPLGSFLGLGQNWSMFAPYPMKDDGWYVIPGTLHEGQQVDLMSVVRGDFYPREGVSWEKPQNVASTHKNEHWRKYLYSIREDENPNAILYFGRYICREWNARHAGAQQLDTFQITYMWETTLPDYQPATPQEQVLWEHNCFASSE